MDDIGTEKHFEDWLKSGITEYVAQTERHYNLPNCQKSEELRFAVGMTLKPTKLTGNPIKDNAVENCEFKKYYFLRKSFNVGGQVVFLWIRAASL